MSSSSASRSGAQIRHTRAPPSFGGARPPLTACALQVQPWATHNLVAAWAPTGGHQSEPRRRRWVDADTGRVPASLLWDLESAAAKREQMCAAPRRATARPACAPPLWQPHEHCTARIFGPRANFSAGQLPTVSPVAGARGARQISRFEIFILTSTLGSPSGCQMRRPAPPTWLLLRGMRPLLMAHVRASDVASCGALHAPRQLDLVLPPFSGQACGASTVEFCALTAAPLVKKGCVHVPNACTDEPNSWIINRGF